MKYDKEMDWPEDYIDNARNMVLDAVAEKPLAPSLQSNIALQASPLIHRNFI